MKASLDPDVGRVAATKPASVVRALAITMRVWVVVRAFDAQEEVDDISTRRIVRVQGDIAETLDFFVSRNGGRESESRVGC